MNEIQMKAIQKKRDKITGVSFLNDLGIWSTAPAGSNCIRGVYDDENFYDGKCQIVLTRPQEKVYIPDLIEFRSDIMENVSWREFWQTVEALFEVSRRSEGRMRLGNMVFFSDPILREIEMRQYPGGYVDRVAVFDVTMIK